LRSYGRDRDYNGSGAGVYENLDLRTHATTAISFCVFYPYGACYLVFESQIFARVSKTGWIPLCGYDVGRPNVVILNRIQ